MEKNTDSTSGKNEKRKIVDPKTEPKIDSQDKSKKKRKKSQDVDSITKVELMTTDYKIALWESLVREVMFKVDCTVIFKCKTTEGINIVTFDHQDGCKFVSIDRFTIPVDLLFLLRLVKIILRNMDVEIIMLTPRRIHHVALPEPESQDDGHRFFYNMPK